MVLGGLDTLQGIGVLLTGIINSRHVKIQEKKPVEQPFKTAKC